MAICTWDSVRKSTNATLSNNNLTVYMPNSSSPAFGSVAHGKGKYYFEITQTAGSNLTIVGITNEKAMPNSKVTSTTGGGADNRCYGGYDGIKLSGADASNRIAYGEKYGIGDYVGIAVDLDNGSIEFFKNGISQGIAFNDIKNLGSNIYPFVQYGSASGYCTVTANFGATPFKYPVAGFKSWNEDEIEEPAPAKLHILLEVGEQIQLIGNVLPEKIGDPNLEWNSSLPNIASVDSTGKVTANAEGVTRIQVKTIDGTWTDYAMVEVVAKDEGDKDQYRLSILLKVGESCLLKFAESGQDIIWQSGTPAVAVVNPSNTQITRVTAQSTGLSLVTVQTADGSKSDQIYVTVIE